MKVMRLDGCNDAFLLEFKKHMHAKVVCIADGDPSDIVRDNGTGNIRLVLFGGPKHSEIPAVVSTRAQACIDLRWASGEVDRRSICDVSLSGVGAQFVI